MSVVLLSQLRLEEVHLHTQFGLRFTGDVLGSPGCLELSEQLSFARRLDSKFRLHCINLRFEFGTQCVLCFHVLLQRIEFGLYNRLCLFPRFGVCSDGVCPQSPIDQLTLHFGDQGLITAT